MIVAVGAGSIAGGATQLLKISRRKRMYWTSWDPALKGRAVLIAAVACIIGGVIGGVVHLTSEAIADFLPTGAVALAGSLATIGSILLLNSSPEDFASGSVATPLNALSQWVLWLKVAAEDRAENAVKIAVHRVGDERVAELSLALHRENLARYESAELREWAHERVTQWARNLTSDDKAEVREARSCLKAFAIARIIEFQQTRESCQL